MYACLGNTPARAVLALRHPTGDSPSSRGGDSVILALTDQNGDD